jgi:hypothetical protein
MDARETKISGEPRPKFGNAHATPILQAAATYTFADTREGHDHFQQTPRSKLWGIKPA